MCCVIGVWILLFVVIVLIISELEFDEVMKNMMIRMMLMKLEIVVSGSCDSIWNSCSFSVVLVMLVKLVSVLVIVVLLKVVIYRIEISEGMISMVIRNCCIVWLCEMWVMNMLINGD